MNKSIIEFLAEEYDYVPVTRGRFDLSEEQVEALLIHMAEDATSTFAQYLFERLEPYVDFTVLSTAIQRTADETMNHYHGVDV